MKNTRIFVLIGLFVLALLALLIVIIFYSQGTRLKICPDHWVVDIAPSIEGSAPLENREYYILNGERMEVSEFDQNWVLQNCQLQKEFVY